MTKSKYSPEARERARALIDRMGFDGDEVPEEALELAQTLFRESDRGAVLVASALVDAELAQLLRAQFQTSEHVTKSAIKPLLRDGAGPLGSMWARARLAYALGTIGPRTFAGIEALRELRNEFAHSSAPAMLTEQAVEPLLRSLEDHEQLVALAVAGTAGDLLQPVPSEQHPAGLKSPRLILIFAAGYVQAAVSRAKSKHA